jgi:hypothetical protein
VVVVFIVKQASGVIVVCGCERIIVVIVESFFVFVVSSVGDVGFLDWFALI